MTKSSRPSLFTRFSRQTSYYAGKPGAFALAVIIILLWAGSGPLFGYSDTWQLVINTSTTIITFLMVFVIQNSQNRDTAALQIKIDELILKLEGPRDALIDLEELDDDEIARLRSEMSDVAVKARRSNRSGAGQTKDGSGKGGAEKSGASAGRKLSRAAAGKPPVRRTGSRTTRAP